MHATCMSPLTPLAAAASAPSFASTVAQALLTPSPLLLPLAQLALMLVGLLICLLAALGQGVARRLLHRTGLLRRRVPV